MSTATPVTFREVGRTDLEDIVRLLSDDELGRQRERYDGGVPDVYYTATEEIERDPNNMLAQKENGGGGLPSTVYA